MVHRARLALCGRCRLTRARIHLTSTRDLNTCRPRLRSRPKRRYVALDDIAIDIADQPFARQPGKAPRRVPPPDRTPGRATVHVCADESRDKNSIEPCTSLNSPRTQVTIMWRALNSASVCPGSKVQRSMCAPLWSLFRVPMLRRCRVRLFTSLAGHHRTQRFVS